MGLFGGGMTQRVRPELLKQAVSAAQPAMPATRPVGLFGRLGALARRPETWEMIGAGLHQIDNPQGQIAALQDRRREQAVLAEQQAWQQEQRGRQRQEWAAGDAQTRARQEYIDGLPAEQRGLALLNPEAFAEGQLAANRPMTPYQREYLQFQRDQLNRSGGSGGSGGGASPAPPRRPVMASADQRGRVTLTMPSVMAAQEDLARLEGQARSQTGNQQETPYGRDWGARLLEAIPWDGGSAARMAGGDDYTAYEQASRTFEQSIMPIFSGSAVTESEAQRFVRANLPRMGDSPAILQRKARNRAMIINQAAIMVGGEPPYPDIGAWSPSGGASAPSAAAERAIQDMTDDELRAIVEGR